MTLNPTNYPWYAIRTRSRFEQTASAALFGKGYESYLPMYSTRRKWSDRSKNLEAPLFPTYLFCRFDIQNRLPVLTTPGVLSIVGAGRNLIAVSDKEIESIQTIERSGLPLHPWPQLAVGSKIVIENGPLKGLEGVTIEIRKKHHLIVSVPLLQRSVSVEIDRNWVRPISVSRSLRYANLKPESRVA
jgi:transcription antitermination factor NusG